MNYTDPHDMHDLGIWVMGWDEDGVRKQVEKFQAQGYPNVFWWIDRNHHETVNMNRTIDKTAERGLSLWSLVNDDVDYKYPETIPAMYDYLKARQEVGAIHPYTQGEPPSPSSQPYDAYLQDATGIIMRLNINGWLPQWDEEFLFTGWADLDIGDHIRRHGGLVINDPRYAVRHDLGNTRRRAKCSYLMAMERRNRLILSAKWWVVGINKWRGIEDYNKTLPRVKQIPTMFELATYTDEELEAMWRSVDFEHPNIRQMNGTIDPNDYWENPVLGGVNVRELSEKGELTQWIIDGKVTKGAGK